VKHIGVYYIVTGLTLLGCQVSVGYPDSHIVISYLMQGSRQGLPGAVVSNVQPSLYHLMLASCGVIWEVLLDFAENITWHPKLDSKSMPVRNCG